MSRRVLVTGGAGYFGSFVVRALLEDPLVSRVVSVDMKSPQAGDSKVRHYAADIRDRELLRNILEEEAIDTVFHLAFVMGEPRDEVLAREVNVAGSLSVLEACDKSPLVRKLVVAGSASAYGARPGNPEFFTETDPLRANTLRYGIHKRVMEEELDRALPGVRQSLHVVMLRICTIVGTSARTDGPVTLFCSLPAGISVLFRPGGLQFITEADLANVMLRVMASADLRGTYNVAPNDYTTLTQLCGALGKPRLPVPYSLLWLGLFLARRLLGRVDVTENAASYMAYPVVLSNAKIRKALGLQFTKGSLEAFVECARSLNTAQKA